MTQKEKYREFCKIEKDIPIFSKDWWLDSVYGYDNWDVIIIEKGGNIMATMPYYLRDGKFGTRIISNPILTQTLGIYFKYPQNQTYYKKLSFEKEIINDCLDNLVTIDQFNTSSKVRQGREMDKAYREYPHVIDYHNKDDFKIVHIGAFHEDTLIGYIELYIYGNFIMINRILGHNKFLKYGVMNLMIKGCVEFTIENNIQYINYLSMQNRHNSTLSAFKYRVGFREYSLKVLV